MEVLSANDVIVRRRKQQSVAPVLETFLAEQVETYRKPYLGETYTKPTPKVKESKRDRAQKLRIQIAKRERLYRKGWSTGDDGFTPVELPDDVILSDECTEQDLKERLLKDLGRLKSDP